MDNETALIKSGEDQGCGIHSYLFSSPETWAGFTGWQAHVRQIGFAIGY